MIMELAAWTLIAVGLIFIGFGIWRDFYAQDDL